jgi:hypothetical protein
VSEELERSHFIRRDLAWLPRSYRWYRWGVSATLFVALAGALGAAASQLDRVPVHVGILFIVFGFVATFAGDRLARRAVRKRLDRLFSGEKGQVVCVRGKVVARRPVESLLGGGRGVYRRLYLDLDGLKAIHETARDFLVVGDDATVLVEVAEARLLDPDDRTEQLAGMGPPADGILALPWPQGLDGALRRRGWARDDDGKLRYEPGVLEGALPTPILAAETLIREGDEVFVVGVKAAVVDADGAGYREAPVRTQLRAGAGWPVVIAARRC